MKLLPASAICGLALLAAVGPGCDAPPERQGSGNLPHSLAPARSTPGPSALSREFATSVQGFATVLSHLTRGTQVSLERTTDAYRLVVPEKSAVELRLPRLASAPFVLERRSDGMALEVELRGGTDAEAHVEDNLALYRAGGPAGSDVLVRASADGFEDFVRLVAPGVNELRYSVRVHAVAGLRLVANTLEFQAPDGTPRLRVSPPYVVDAERRFARASLRVEGCAYDTSTRLPWHRPLTPPGASTCEVVVAWSDTGLAYPLVVDPVWGLTRKLAERRVWHTATPVPAEAEHPAGVFVIGGRNQLGAALATGEFFREEENIFDASWTSIGSFEQEGRYEHTTTKLLDNSLLVAGGTGDPGPWTTLWRYRRGTGLWERSLDLPLGGPLSRHTATSVGSSVVFIGGGWTKALTLRDAHLDTARWETSGTMMSTPRFRHTATLSGDRIFAIGGTPNYDSGDPLASIEAYDTVDKVWEPPDEPMEIGRAAHTATLLEQRSSSNTPLPELILVVGNNGTPRLFDPDEREWLPIASQAHLARRHHAAVTLSPEQKFVLVIGGENGSLTHRGSEVFERVPQRWTTPSGTLWYSRQGHTATVLSDERTVLVVGGEDSTALVYNDGELATVGTPGDVCVDSDDCLLGHCRDGICCDQKCEGECEACAESAGAAVDGVCRLISDKPCGEEVAEEACSERAVCDGRTPGCPRPKASEDGKVCSVDEQSGTCSEGECMVPSETGGAGGESPAPTSGGGMPPATGGEGGDPVETAGQAGHGSGGVVSIGGTSSGASVGEGGDALGGAATDSGSGGQFPWGSGGTAGPRRETHAFQCSAVRGVTPRPSRMTWIFLAAGAFLIALRRGSFPRLRAVALLVGLVATLCACGDDSADDAPDAGDDAGRGGSVGSGNRGGRSGRGGSSGGSINPFAGMMSGGAGDDGGAGMAAGAAGQSAGGQGGQGCDLDSRVFVTWRRVEAAGGPEARRLHAMASVESGTLLMGGARVGGALADSWLFGAGVWSQAAAGPPARAGLSLSALGEIGALLFGGIGNEGALGDTWRWDGEWAPECQDDCEGPPARWAHSAAWFADQNEVVMFGGTDGLGILSDTWAWRSSGWRRICGGSDDECGPSARFDHALVYDVAAKRIILVGGNDGSQDLEDVWAFDGEEWKQIPIDGALPGPRSGHVLGYSERLGKVLLFGGVDNGLPIAPDTWALTTETGRWQLAESQGEIPVSRPYAAFAFDGSEFVLQGGGSQEVLGDTLTLSVRELTSEARCVCASNCEAECPGEAATSCRDRCEAEDRVSCDGAGGAGGAGFGGEGGLAAAGSGGSGVAGGGEGGGTMLEPECAELEACCLELASELREPCTLAAAAGAIDVCAPTGVSCTALVRDPDAVDPACIELAPCCAGLAGNLRTACVRVLAAREGCENFLVGGFCP